MRYSIPPLVVLGLAGALSAQHVILSKNGSQPGESFGWAVAAVGDIDRDGTADFAVGAPEQDYGSRVARGIVRVVSGADGRTLLYLPGPRTGTRLGSSVAGVGDVDGDGYPDLAAGGPSDSAGGGARAGYACVRSGRDGRVLWEVTGEPGSELGHSVCGIGDLDRDGYPDVAIGAPENSNRTPFGIVRIYSGRTGAHIRGVTSQNSGAGFGFSVANAGDVDGDGRADLVIGEPRGRGARNGTVWMFSTRSTAMPKLWESYGSFSDARLGSAVRGGGDIDGDGVPDVVAGGTGAGGNSCSVHVLSGRTGARIHRHLAAAGTAFGGAVDIVGDFDGDGRDDYAVGAPREGGGGVLRVYGSSGAVALTVNGAAGDGLGHGVAGLGDVDGAGLADVAVGLPWADGAGTDAGAVEVRGLDLPGGWQQFGSGCRNARGDPLLAGAGYPRPGRPLHPWIAYAQPNAPGVMLLSGTRTLWRGLALPFDLSVLGMTGCELLVGMDVQVPFVVASDTTASLTFSVPDTPAVIGARLHLQALIGDTVNPAGFVTSNGLTYVIGNR